MTSPTTSPTRWPGREITSNQSPPTRLDSPLGSYRAETVSSAVESADLGIKLLCKVTAMSCSRRYSSALRNVAEANLPNCARTASSKFVNSASRQTISIPLATRSEEHTSELQSRRDLVCRLLLEKKNRMAVTS